MIYISTTLVLVGVLAIYLRMMGLTRIVTTDIKDDGEVAENILFNTQQNGTALSCISHHSQYCRTCIFILTCMHVCIYIGLEPQLHIPHTWGTSWDDSRKEALALVVGDYHDDDNNDDADGTVGSSSVSRMRRYLDGSNIRFIIASDILLYVR